MKRMSFAVFILLVVFLVSPSQAQTGKGAVPRFYADFKPVVGAWAEYQVTGKGEQPTKMKIAIIAKEGDSFWFENVMETKQEGRMISKMLVSGNPEDQNNTKRMVVKMGDQPAMEMPVQMMARPKPQGQKGKVTDKGTESIKVPAGTFTAQHMQYQEGDVAVDTWAHKDVAPYGIVKSQSKEFEMVLIGYGMGAKTLITETPQKLEMPKMPMMPPKTK